MATVKDTWNAGEFYEPYIGRWSRLVARHFLPWLKVPPGSRWLDVGCGPGALVEAILESEHPDEVLGVDPSPEFIAYARLHSRDPLAHFQLGDAEHLSVERGHFDAAVSALVLNLLERPDRALAAMRTALRPGGIVAAYVWDYADQMQFLRAFWDTAGALDPKAAALDERRRFPLCQPPALERLFREAALRDVTTRAIDIETPFANFDDFWQPFLGGQGPAPTYVLSLSGEHRERLRQRLQATLPIAADGSLSLQARAWAVRGVR